MKNNYFYIFWLLVGVLLWGSWLSPVTRLYWDQWDEAFFFAANGTLASHSMVQIGWSIANHRAFDLVPALLFGVAYLYFMRTNTRAISTYHVIAHGFFMLFFAIMVVQIMHLLFSQGRLSPTLVLEPHYRLTELVPWIEAKDASARSFPGDHATVLLLFAVFLHTFCGPRYRWVYGAALLFSLPRLFSGAHWLTDVVIGGFASALIAASLALIFPIRDYSCAALYSVLQKVSRRSDAE